MIAVRVQREPSEFGVTLGACYVNDRFVCWTLEDVMREIPGIAVANWKVPGKTAIPAGRYELVMEWSPKFQMTLPELKGVPGFSETKFHAGNRAEDTEGCIIVGRVREDRAVRQSRLALDDLLLRLKSFAGEPMFVDVENPPGRHLSAPSQTRFA